ncbi:YbaB/EbfC family nucleoid-associated protein [Actinoallomurus purpureus]|uniref:YbaB/EbfC family nucleoid-associated protein n=1 Tax=Actinoallomurus purpureus TaxID=478114 RepID=UPI0020925815|nr:YbaB/EbfC family nucleoid-associated protein [Actinoallomurus purpureus]MCO6005459.1 YbaB/EbfC family nucleoid-associated protein [Actinoallomurus purpureus]
MARPDDIFGRIGDEELGRFLSKFSDSARQLDDLRQEFGDIRGRSESADGNVVVEALPGGALARLEIKPRAMRLGSEALAAAILEAVNQAGQDATEKVTGRMNEAMTSFYGEAERFTGG